MDVTEAMPAARPPLLLTTKAVPPRLPAGLLDRPRLTGLSAEAGKRRLTVIKAPAGFGKTSLALSWLDLLRAGGEQVAWLALDAGDDEPARFFHHLAHALLRACGSVGASTLDLTTEASLVPASSLAATLINELAEVEDELYVFVDDYHLIADAAIHEAMALFVAHVPSWVHVVICTRTDPPLPLGKLRAGNELLEIDAAALRFDLDETRRFVQTACPEKLPQGDVEVLFARTEGWAAALRISASVLAREHRPHGWKAGAPTGASRPMADYLEDILQRLPADMLAFMLQTSVLERLCAPLCEALTGLRTSQAMLQAIVARQLLLEPLDVEERWFRYHPLMMEYLRRRLQDTERQRVAGLHRRAWQWYAGEQQWTDAVRHAIAAGATGDAIRMMEHCAKALLKAGDLLTLVGWQRQFPADLMRAQLTVRLATAWGMALAMRFDEAAAMADAIEHDAQSKDKGEGETIGWECLALRSALAALQDEPQRALALARQYLAQPSTDAWTANAVSNVARYGHWKAGDLEALYATPWLADPVETDQRSVFSAVYRLCLLGHAELQQLHVAVAEQRFQEAMQLAERYASPRSIAAALCAPLVAQLFYEQGRLEEAEALLLEHMPVIDVAAFLDSVLVAYRIRVRIAMARANVVQAHTLLDEAQALGQARRWNRLIAAALSERTRIFLAEDRLVEAAACVTQLGRLACAGDDGTRTVSPEIENYRDLGAACVALKRHLTREAVAALEASLARLARGHGHYLALRLRTLLALAWLHAGERDRALQTFREVAKVAAPAGVYQSLLDQGPEIGPLLRLAREATPGYRENNRENNREAQAVNAWLDRLLAGWQAQHEPKSPSRREAEREMLSARERNIVELIAQGQSNKEIARSLGITPETVKTHVKSVFTKLGVDKRAQAVSRAQALGLLKQG